MTDPIRAQLAAIYPVTALNFVQTSAGRLLLAGQGPHLCFYCAESCKFIGELEIFSLGSIRGIKAFSSTSSNDHTFVVVWAGCSLCFVELRCYRLEDQLCISVPSTILKGVDDWILDACFVSCLSGEQQAHAYITVVFVTAHNVLSSVRVNREQHDTEYVETKRLISGPRSLLCSAEITCPSSNVCVVAAGTVFGEVLLWSCSIDHSAAWPPEVTASEQHHCFRGHEGSVFGVAVFGSGSFNKDPSNKWFLASCSDDRTIRIYDIGGINGGDPAQEAFGGLEINGHIAMVTGHGSRIWGLHIVGRTQGSWCILSRGEDSTAQIWRFNDNAQLTTAMKPESCCELLHVSTYKHHVGKNLWTAAISEDINSTVHIATAAADGRIATFLLEKMEKLHSGGGSWTRCRAGDAAQDAIFNSDNSKASLDVRFLISNRSPVIDLFLKLKGNWRLRRELASAVASYPSGSLNGTAAFEEKPPTDPEYDMEYLYSEYGQLTTKQGFKLSASRRYVYRYQKSTDQITVWFVKPEDGLAVDYFFHTLNFSPSEEPYPSNGIRATGHHLCVNDDYYAHYRFNFQGGRHQAWEVKYVVKGPNKDYSATSQYCRENENSPLNIFSGHESVQDAAMTLDKVAEAVKTDDQKQDEEDSFNTYAWLNDKSLLATTNSGNILLGSLPYQSFESAQAVSWRRVAKLSDLQNKCVIAIVDYADIAFFAGANGTIHMYSHRSGCITRIAKLPGKVACFQASNWRHMSGSGIREMEMESLFVFATCLGFANAYCLLLHVRTGVFDCDKASLELPGSFVATASRWIGWEGTLVLGSRNGGIAIYSTDWKENVETQAVQLLHAKNVHRGDAVTTIIPLPAHGKATDSYQFYFLSAGRDGSYAVHRLKKTRYRDNRSRFDFATVHACTLLSGPILKGPYSVKARMN